MDHLVHLKVRSGAPLKGTLMHTFAGAHARSPRIHDLLTQTEKFPGSTHPSTHPDLARCQQ